MLRLHSEKSGLAVVTMRGHGLGKRPVAALTTARAALHEFIRRQPNYEGQQGLVNVSSNGRTLWVLPYAKEQM